MKVDICDELYINIVCDYFDLLGPNLIDIDHKADEFDFQKQTIIFNKLCGLEAFYEYIIEDSKYRFTVLDKNLWLFAKIKYGF